MNQLWPIILEQLKHNQFLSGGLVVGGMGMAAAYLRALPAKCYYSIRGQMVVSLHIDGHDPVFPWMKYWVSHQRFSHRSRDKELSSSWADRLGITKSPETESSIPANTLLTPSPGRYYFFRRRWPFWIDIAKHVPKEGAALIPVESMTLYSVGRNSNTLSSIAREASELVMQARGAGVNVYASGGWYWKSYGVQMPRPPESLVYDGTILEDIVADANEFLESRAFYNKQGIPWRRGYLLYGEAGTGKTSLVGALATNLKRDIYIFNLKSTSDSDLWRLLSEVPDGGIVLFEEIDSCIPTRVRESAVTANATPQLQNGSSQPQSATLAGLLNALDGIASKEGRIAILTTNYPEKLDAALIRPGRCDRKFYIGLASRSQVGGLFRNFYEGVSVNKVNQAMNAVTPHTLSMATLQECFMRHLTDPDGAIDALQKINSESQPIAEHPNGNGNNHNASVGIPV